MYRSLDAAEIIRTLETLQRRIEERFPGSGLAGVAAELLAVARESRTRAEAIVRPNVALRVAVATIIATMLAGLVGALLAARPPSGAIQLPDLIQVLEAGINDVVLIGAAIFFLVTFETRVKRARALGALHELRSIAHVIDMHQLTKDPAAIVGTVRATASSPPRRFTPAELKRYLDYCSELLSLTGKIAALYVQRFGDSVAIAAVNEVENLTTSLSSKVWQKITILEAFEAESRRPGSDRPE